MARHVVYLMSLAVVIGVPAVAGEPQTAAQEKPQWQRLLQGDDAKKAADRQERINAAEGADQYDDAIKLHEELLSLRTAVQGADHWETANEKWALDGSRKVAALPAEQRAGWRKAFQGAFEANQLEANGHYVKAEPLREEYRRWCKEIFGEKHPHTATSYHNLAVNLKLQGRYSVAEPLYRKSLDLNLALLGENHPNTAASYHMLATNLGAQGKYADAEPLLQKALDLSLKLLGEKHPDTAGNYNDLGFYLGAQGKYAEAQRLLQTALDLSRELLGEKHPFTATGYDNLAANLGAQGKYADAQPLHQKALDLRREVLGENNPSTARSFNNLAANLNSQGKYAEAQPLYQKALDLKRELLGEKHPDTANSYNNLATNLDAQGKYAEAQPVCQKAVDLNLELLGEKHPNTAASIGNLAVILNAQRKYAEAQPLYAKALDLKLKLLGEKHPDTATSYNNLAYNLDALGQYADAQRLHQRALDLCCELLGEKHRHTARSYNNLATNLNAQGKYAEAHPLNEKALVLNRELLGESHPDTAYSFLNLASNNIAQGKYADAQPLLANAAAAYEAARLSVAGRGLDRADFGTKQSPYGLLAAAQARLDSSSAAWVAAETDLARGLFDENSVRDGAALTADEQHRQSAATMRLSQLQPLILQLVSKESPTDAERFELGRLKHEQRTLESKLSDLAVVLSQRELANLPQVQSTIPTNAALVLWVDVADKSGQLQEHWGCVLRESGGPFWERVPGTGTENKWTTDDSALPRKLSEAVTGGASEAEIADLAAKLYSQRIAPLEKHLDGVTRLFAIPVNWMAGVPIEVLTDKFTISYVPSGTFLARLKDRPAPSVGSLLALGDPVFPPAEPLKELPLPPGGLLITQVLPTGNAAQARLQPGDVLLKYARAELTAVEQLGKLVQEHVQDKSVPISIWREGETADRDLAPGKLGVVLDRQPAPEAIVDKRDVDKMLLAVARGGDWAELPGSAIEVDRLTKLTGEGEATALTRSAASEQELEQLRSAGKLAEFRYLHFATHGEPNNARSFESALILAQDQISKDIPLGGGKYYDGRLTANEVLETWKLDNAELVTLSACESALGRPGGGDGVLGFAQAFLLAGSRAVCLSLWKVDDTATALLMDRFYQNLLGKRTNLANPMPKAAALAEAKRWLRELSVDEAAKLAADMTGGVARGKDEPALNLVVQAADPEVASEDSDRPFSHPRYWAAFILIGDPD